MNDTLAGPSHGSIRQAWYSKNARRSGSSFSMSWLCCHASGIIIRIECGSVRPFTLRNCSALSNVAESDPDSVRIGNIFPSSSPNTLLCSDAPRARIQFRLPRSVLISPLWATYRNGWASHHAGNVFVENRLCTIASELSKSGSVRSR